MRKDVHGCDGVCLDAYMCVCDFADWGDIEGTKFFERRK